MFKKDHFRRNWTQRVVELRHRLFHLLTAYCPVEYN